MEAEVLYPRAVSILEDLHALEEEICAVGKTVSGKLIIGASTIPSAYILPLLAAQFKHKHPQTSFEIRTFDTAEVINGVLKHELLLGVVGAKTVSNQLTFNTFADDELVLIASTKRKIKPIITLDELKQQPFLLREEGSGTRKSLEDFLARKEIDCEQLNISAILGSSTAIKEAVQADLGISIISNLAITNALDCKRIKKVEIKGVTLKRSFYTVRATKRTLPYQYQIFLKEILGRRYNYG